MAKIKFSCIFAKGSARTEEGGVAVYVALVSAVMIGFGALVVDLGRLFTLQTELQNAADVAALAGAAELDGKTDSITRARAAATTALVTASSPTGILNFQTYAPGGADVTFDPNADIRFLSSLPATDDDPITASHLTTDPRNAFYIEVTARPRQIDYLLADLLRNLVPAGPRSRLAVLQGLGTHVQVPLVPTVEGARRDPQLSEGGTNGQIRLLDQADHLHLLGSRPPHKATSSPRPVRLFLSTRFFSVISATTSFSSRFSERSALTSLPVASRTVSP